MNATATKTTGSNAYGPLKTYGFSAPKAAEIALDAKRGDPYALQFAMMAASSDPETTGEFDLIDYLEGGDGKVF